MPLAAHRVQTENRLPPAQDPHPQPFSQREKGEGRRQHEKTRPTPNRPRSVPLARYSSLLVPLKACGLLINPARLPLASLRTSYQQPCLFALRLFSNPVPPKGLPFAQFVKRLPRNASQSLSKSLTQLTSLLRFRPFLSSEGLAMVVPALNERANERATLLVQHHFVRKMMSVTD